MSTLFNLFNELSLSSNEVYEQNIINNVIQQSLLESNPIKHILSEEGEKELEIVKYKSIDYSMKNCPITLLEFNDDDMVTKLPCNHIFDSSGIMWWLKTEQASCPICRTKLTSKEISTSNHANNANTNDISDNNNHHTNITTNPLTLFSNITIDLSLNQQLLQPYNRNYNLQSFETLLDSIEELSDDDYEEDDDLYFLNTLQMMQEEDEFMANFQHILTDHSNNNTYKDTDTE
jgi:hypothetical protein